MSGKVKVMEPVENMHVIRQKNKSMFIEIIVLSKTKVLL